MKKFLSFFYTDLHWKLLALALAFALWFVGSNVNNPSQTGRINVPLQLHNIEILANEGLILVNEEALREAFIQVGVRATRRELERLSGADAEEQSAMIVPSIDFRAVDIAQVLDSDGPVTVRLDVGVNLYLGYEHFSISPSFIDVQIDAIARETFPVSIDVVGEVAPGLELRPISLLNNNVTVTGSRACIASIERLSVVVNVLGIHSDTEIANVPLMVLDHNGNDITSRVQLSVMETTAIVSVWAIDNLGVQVEARGDVAPGFALAGITFEPDFVMVVGKASLLQESDFLLAYVDITNFSQNAMQRIDISQWLPDGVYLRSGASPIIDVHVEIEPIQTRVFNIHRDDVRIFGMAAIHQILDEAALIEVRISGLRSIVMALNSSDIGLDLNLRTLQIGVHRVTLGVHAPEGTTLVGNAPTLQVQIHEPADLDNDEYYTYYPNLPDPPVVYPEPDLGNSSNSRYPYELGYPYYGYDPYYPLYNGYDYDYPYLPDSTYENGDDEDSSEDSENNRENDEN